MGDEPVKSQRDESSGGGCVSTILGLLLLWALIFGVNYNGHHYGIACRGDGLTIERTERR